MKTIELTDEEVIMLQDMCLNEIAVSSTMNSEQEKECYRLAKSILEKL